MPDRPSVIVAGLGRCGSSLTMQMLAAGGYPVVGEYPAFEPDSVRALRRQDNPPLYAGRAVKLVFGSAWDWRTSHRDALVLYCVRDPDEQAKSQIKFASLMQEITPDLSSPMVRRMRKLLRKDDRRARDWLRPRAGEWLDVPFEDTINRPLAAAAGLAAFLGGDLDVSAIANAVRMRTARCHPTLFEQTLLEKAA